MSEKCHVAHRTWRGYTPRSGTGGPVLILEAKRATEKRARN